MSRTCKSSCALTANTHCSPRFSEQIIPLNLLELYTVFGFILTEILEPEQETLIFRTEGIPYLLRVCGPCAKVDHVLTNNLPRIKTTFGCGKTSAMMNLKYTFVLLILAAFLALGEGGRR